MGNSVTHTGAHSDVSSFKSSAILILKAPKEELTTITSKIETLEEELNHYKDKLDRFLREERNLPVYAEIIGTEAVYTGVVAMHEDK